MKNNYGVVALVIIILIVGVFVFSQFARQTYLTARLNTPAPTILAKATGIPSPASVLGVQTKTSGCEAINGMPDSTCTPGAVFPDVTASDVCKPGYASSVRDVSESTKNQAYLEYGILTHQTGQYEVDHLISLELGGSNELSNLWPEAADPKPGDHEKDKVENYLHSQVCKGAITLQVAQQEISTDWLSIYKQISQN